MQWQFNIGSETTKKISREELCHWHLDLNTQRLVRSSMQDGVTVERNIHLRFAKLPTGKTHISQSPTLELHIGAGQMRRQSLLVQLDLPLSMLAAGAAGSGPQDIESPMTGKVIKILISEGDKVEKGQAILTVEAMKMENQILAPITGKVENLAKKVGESVNSGELLAIISPQ